jgi:hypothetical protein
LSPVATPANASNLFNSIRFTPVCPKINFDLADAPTPKASTNYKLYQTPEDATGTVKREELVFGEEIRRRLNATSSPIDSPMKVLTPKSIRSKTKVIYHTEEIVRPEIVLSVGSDQFDPNIYSTVTKSTHFEVENCELESKRLSFQRTDSCESVTEAQMINEIQIIITNDTNGMYGLLIPKPNVYFLFVFRKLHTPTTK